jgi:hypothetical protein
MFAMKPSAIRAKVITDGPGQLPARILVLTTKS